MNEKFEQLIERAGQLLTRIESILPQPLTAPRLERLDRLALPQALLRPWRAGAGAPRGRDPLDDLKEIEPQKEKIRAQHAAVRRRASRPTTCC